MTRTTTQQRASVARMGRAEAASGVLAALAVLVQMVFPFTDGGTPALTTASVVLLSGAALAHAGATRGVRAVAALVLVPGLGGLVAEAVGVSTGVPFGEYAYSGTLGWEVLGVPVLVPLAWVMMTWPALVVGRLLAAGRSRGVRALVAAWALMAWDVFLDPQMVDAGHWTWRFPEPSLPGVEGIPLTNFAGWFLVALLFCGMLDRVVEDSPRPLRSDAVPYAVYLWTYFSSVLAHAAFFGRPSVAVVGAVVMGVVAVPLALRLAGQVRR